MSISDPISDMLTRIRNASRAYQEQVTIPGSNLKKAIADVLKSNGYIQSYEQTGDKKLSLSLSLKYHREQPVIDDLERVSKPSCRVYVNSKEIPRVQGGLGIAILSTSKGVMSDKKARQEQVGGEVLCYVW